MNFHLFIYFVWVFFHFFFLLDFNSPKTVIPFPFPVGCHYLSCRFKGGTNRNINTVDLSNYKNLTYARLFTFFISDDSLKATMKKKSNCILNAYFYVPVILPESDPRT